MCWVARIAGDRRGAVSLVYALLLVTMLVALGIGLDGSNALEARYRLDLAADAAAVACGETWQTNITAETGNKVSFATAEVNANSLAQKQAQQTFYAQAGSLMSTLSGPPVINVTNGTAPGAQGASVTCAVSYTASSPTYLTQLAGFHTVPVAGGSNSTVELAPYTEVYLILDTSASMMVGSTPTDQGLIATWAMKHDQALAANDPTRLLSGGDTPPCAFACHDTAAPPFHVSDMIAGQSNAHAAKATTRFDVMRLALVNDPSPPNGVTQFCTPSAQATSSTTTVVCGATGSQEGLLPYIRDTFQVTNARANLNTFTYTMYGFNEGINGNEPPAGIFDQDVPDTSQTVVAATSTLSTVSTGVNQLNVGLNTHLMPPGELYSKTSNSVLQDLVNIVGTTKTTSTPGTTSDNPLKFLIIITDGMSSDRNWNWCAPPGNSGCNNDPYPVGSPVTTTTISTVCQNWSGTAQVFGGTSTYKGTGCLDINFGPGFWPTPVSSTEKGTLQGNNPAWPGSAYTGTGTDSQLQGTYSIHYASPIDVDGTKAWTQTGANAGKSFCSQIKANGGNPGLGTLPGVTIAVLETPYVPMNGQDPSTYPGNNYPYDTGVQQIIYPSGNPMKFPSAYPAGPHGEQMSALSNALLACATSSSYYFQATDDAAIATGFIQLFNTFVGQWVHLTQ